MSLEEAAATPRVCRHGDKGRVKTREKVAICKSRREEASGETSPTGTWILDFQFQNYEEVHFCYLSQSVVFCYTAWADQYKALDNNNDICGIRDIQIHKEPQSSLGPRVLSLEFKELLWRGPPLCTLLKGYQQSYELCPLELYNSKLHIYVVHNIYGWIWQPWKWSVKLLPETTFNLVWLCIFFSWKEGAKISSDF